MKKTLFALLLCLGCTSNDIENRVNVNTPDNRDVLEDISKKLDPTPEPTPAPALSLQGVWQGEYVVKVPHEVTIKTTLSLNPDDSFVLSGQSEIGAFEIKGTYQVNETENTLTFESDPTSLSTPCETLNGVYAFTLEQELRLSKRDVKTPSGCTGQTGQALTDPTYTR